MFRHGVKERGLGCSGQDFFLLFFSIFLFLIQLERTNEWVLQTDPVGLVQFNVASVLRGWSSPLSIDAWMDGWMDGQMDR